MRKVLIVCKGHAHVAGAQLYLQQIASLFPKDKFELCFALRPGDGLKFVEEIGRKCNVGVVDYDWRHLPFAACVSKGYRLFRETKPDLILFNSPEDPVLGPLWAAGFAKVPKKLMVVHWAQSETDLPLFSKNKRLWKIPMPSRYAITKRLVRALSYRLLDAVIFVSHGTRRAYASLYKVPEAKCHTIYNGVDAESYHRPSLRNAVRTQLGLHDDEGMLLATGNLTSVKGHRYLLEAVQKVAARGLQLKCFIAGRGELEDDLKRQIQALGLEGRVFLLGYRKDIPALLSAADLFCMPSLNEAFGYSLVEAMAAELPVVASAVGGIPEVLRHEHEGLLVPPGDSDALAAAIERLWHQPELRKNMGAEGAATVKQRFDLSIMLRQTEQLLKLLLENQEPLAAA
jgi:glycosyltransferase involved in cell wall biosynthesis